MKKIEQAKKLLQQGAKWRYALETNSFTGRTQFNARLIMNGSKVRGFGMKTFLDMQNELVAVNSTSVSTHYALAS